ncbi:DUF433 domain-containing protein [Hymenobacter artigasi]|uniref:Uncharacterized protein (DUF433 family) n=1 Tax=Hymenobacter artigasi TaxID=2719616 RepID=A0ABX1HEM3_9BACT|nr:DUF433 domain-containing protein [Hymenobacter artigasi]NKI88470.1 uncharacterized protein (DUF433 family) [Hymenobacter artigasi]
MQTTDALLARITIDARILAGKPTIRGLRISVQQILKALAAGQTQNDLIQEYPELEPEDFQGVLLYAADVVGEQRVYRLSA